MGSLMPQPQPTVTEVVEFHARRAGLATNLPTGHLSAWYTSSGSGSGIAGSPK